MLFTLRNGALPAPHTTTPANRLSAALDQFFDAPPARTGLPLTVWEDEHAVRVELDVPGVAPGDIDLSVHDGVLTVRGERKAGDKPAAFDGRRYGAFTQTVALPDAVNPDAVEAAMTNGVLAVTLPKTPQSKPRKIEVRAA